MKRNPYDRPRISAALVRNPAIVPSREAALASFVAAIGKAVPEYSPEELSARATLWTDSAIAKGAVIIRSEGR